LKLGEDVVNLASRALEHGRTIIPHHISKADTLEQTVANSNAEQWGNIFRTQRYVPTCEKVMGWKNEQMVFKKFENYDLYRKLFRDYFSDVLKEIDLKVESLAEAMKHDPQHVIGMQVDHHRKETEQRQDLTQKLFSCIEQVSQRMTQKIYSDFISVFVQEINRTICPEDPTLFNTSLREDHCNLEILSLLKRVAGPLLFACLLWPHDFKPSREDAVKDLVRTVPWVAFRVCAKKNSTPNFTKAVAEAMRWTHFFNRDEVNLPKEFLRLIEQMEF